MIKRIGAFILAGALILLYISTLVFSLMQNPIATELLKASVAATILVPVLIYAYQLVYRLLINRNNNTDNKTDNKIDNNNR